MQKQLLICLAVCLALTVCKVLKGQNTQMSFQEKYEKETLFLDLDENVYIKDKEKKKIGFFGNKLKNEFDSVSQESKAEYASFRKRTKRGKIMVIAGSTVFLAAAIVAPVIIGPAFAIGFGAGIGTYSFGVADIYKSRRHLNKAVWLRNRDVLAQD